MENSQIMLISILTIIFLCFFYFTENFSDSNSTLHVIIPFRDRENNLKKLLPSLKKNISRKYKVWIIEQYDKKLFHKTFLLNSGYKEIKKRGLIQKNDDIVLHDVDNLPLNCADYSKCTKGTVRHLFAGKPGWKTLGGVVLINSSDFEKVNGYSNKFIGYGLEDNDFYDRVNRVSLLIDSDNATYRFNNPNKKCFEEIQHDKKKIKIETNLNRNEIIKNNEKVLKENRKNPKLQHKEGLNTVNYKILSEEIIDNNTIQLKIISK